MKSPQVKLGQRRARREYVQAHRRAAIFLCKPPHPAAAGRGRLRPAMPVARRRFERSVREDAACLRARGSRLERRRLRRRVSRKCVGRCIVRRGRRPQCVHGAPPLPATAASSWARGKRDLDGASTILGRMRCGRFETPVAAPRAGRAQRATLDAHTRECAMLMLEAPAQPLPAWPGTEWGAGAGRYVGGEACASGRGARGAARRGRRVSLCSIAAWDQVQPWLPLSREAGRATCSCRLFSTATVICRTCHVQDACARPSIHACIHRLRPALAGTAAKREARAHERHDAVLAWWGAASARRPSGTRHHLAPPSGCAEVSPAQAEPWAGSWALTGRW